MPTATLPAATDSPFTQSHQRELTAAAALAEPVRRAGRVAAFNAWSTAILAVCAAPFAAFSVDGFIIFAALALVAWNEFRGRRRMLDFDPAGATILGWNQLALLAIVLAYCGWATYSGLYGATSLDAQMETNPDLRAAVGMLGNFGDLYKQILLLTYGTVAALSIVFQGGNALYYFSRRPLVEDYVAATPAWVRDVQRAT
jgi:hypothetical protein